MVQGPMGKGLDVQKDGVHIAFAAGTGILAFADLIGYLIVSLTMPQLCTEASLGDSFKFILHYSYYDSKEAVCLDLIQALVTLCEKQGKKDLFEFHPRVSKTFDEMSEIRKRKRWDQGYFKNQIEKGLESGVKRMYVCGPPLVQENFDRAQDSIKDPAKEGKIIIL